MKILQLATHYEDIGGGPKMIHDIATLLHQSGHYIEVLYSTAIHAPFKNVRWPTHHVPDMWGDNERSTKQSALDALHIANDMQPDLVICHGPIDPIVVDMLGKDWDTVKFVHAYHDCPAHRRLFTRNDRVCHKPLGPTCLAHWYLDRCGTNKSPRHALQSYKTASRELDSLRRARMVLANSDYVRQSLISNGCRPENVRVFPLFSMVDEVEPTMTDTLDGATFREAVPGSNDAGFVLFAGRVGYEKGIPYLLRAFAHVASPARLVVAGEGYYLPVCREIATSLGIQDRVEFLGWVPAHDMDDLYKRASMLAAPSIWPEPFGLIGLEAGRYGCPVVAFAVGGIPEWLGSLVPGTAVPPLDIQAFAAAINHHLTHPISRGDAAAAFLHAHDERKVAALTLLQELADGHALAPARPALSGVGM